MRIFFAFVLMCSIAPAQSFTEPFSTPLGPEWLLTSPVLQHHGMSPTIAAGVATFDNSHTSVGTNDAPSGREIMLEHELGDGSSPLNYAACSVRVVDIGPYSGSPSDSYSVGLFVGMHRKIVRNPEFAGFGGMSIRLVNGGLNEIATDKHHKETGYVRPGAKLGWEYRRTGGNFYRVYLLVDDAYIYASPLYECNEVMLDDTFGRQAKLAVHVTSAAPKAGSSMRIVLDDFQAEVR